KSGWL
ncbi:hypothetical protein D047_0781B, partial [Vibrio parahaemolyticus VPTS-2010_2]